MVIGNEMLDGFTKEAAGSQQSQWHRAPDEHLWEISLSYLTQGQRKTDRGLPPGGPQTTSGQSDGTDPQWVTCLRE